MSIDHRTRRLIDIRPLSLTEVLDTILPEAIENHGESAARAIAQRELPAIGFSIDGTEWMLCSSGDRIEVAPGIGRAELVIAMNGGALSDFMQDYQSTMGLAMTSRVRVERGTMDDWIGWEPAFRALLDGRKAFEPGDVQFLDLDGGPLDLDRVFTPEDELPEIAHFLREAGFLHLRGIFDPDEMAGVGDDIDHHIARAKPDDGDSWWAEDADGTSQAVRVLNFFEKSERLRSLVGSDRYQWLGGLTGDGHQHRLSAEGLVKPLGIVKGLSDLPWHKDCGQGRHSYHCNALTCGISITGADRVSGALGVVPGSHRANVKVPGRDPLMDLKPRMLETQTGDITVHCSDTLHRAHPPTKRPRKVVYSGFELPLLPGDEKPDQPHYSRQARAELSNVEDRIAATVTTVDQLSK